MSRLGRAVWILEHSSPFKKFLPLLSFQWILWSSIPPQQR